MVCLGSHGRYRRWSCILRSSWGIANSFFRLWMGHTEISWNYCHQYCPAYPQSFLGSGDPARPGALVQRTHGCCGRRALFFTVAVLRLTGPAITFASHCWSFDIVWRLWTCFKVVATLRSIWQATIGKIFSRECYSFIMLLFDICPKKFLHADDARSCWIRGDPINSLWSKP